MKQLIVILGGTLLGCVILDMMVGADKDSLLSVAAKGMTSIWHRLETGG